MIRSVIRHNYNAWPCFIYMSINIKTKIKEPATARESREREAYLVVKHLRDVNKKQKAKFSEKIKQLEKQVEDLKIMCRLLRSKNKVIDARNKN